MKQDDIIRFAIQCHLVTTGNRDGLYMDSLIEFAHLVAAKEREACAKVCEEKVDAEYKTGKVDHNEMGWTQSCAADIRARGEQA